MSNRKGPISDAFTNPCTRTSHAAASPAHGTAGIRCTLKHKCSSAELHMSGHPAHATMLIAVSRPYAMAVPVACTFSTDSKQAAGSAHNRQCMASPVALPPISKGQQPATHSTQSELTNLALHNSQKRPAKQGPQAVCDTAPFKQHLSSRVQHRITRTCSMIDKSSSRTGSEAASQGSLRPKPNAHGGTRGDACISTQHREGAQQAKLRPCKKTAVLQSQAGRGTSNA